MRTKNPCTNCNTKLSNSIIPELCVRHNNLYDYSLVTNNVKRKIDIICTKHGVFNQDIYSHLNGSGCPKCAGFKKSTNNYIQEASIIHANKYDYSKVVYEIAHEYITIIYNLVRLDDYMPFV